MYAGTEFIGLSFGVAVHGLTLYDPTVIPSIPSMIPQLYPQYPL